MPDDLRVCVPADLARELEADGIEELEQVRSLDWLAQSATIAVTVVGTAANLTTVLLAKDALGRFIHRVASWAAGRANGAPANELTIRFDRQDADGEGSRRSIVAKISGPGTLSGEELTVLMSFIAAAFADQPDLTS